VPMVVSVRVVMRHSGLMIPLDRVYFLGYVATEPRQPRCDREGYSGSWLWTSEKRSRAATPTLQVRRTLSEARSGRIFESPKCQEDLGLR
jgi:hypothetical protein